MLQLLLISVCCLPQDLGAQQSKTTNPKAEIKADQLLLERAQAELVKAVLDIDTALVLEAVPFLTAKSANADQKPEYTAKSNIPYATVGDRELLLDAYVPTKKGIYPAVLVIHGGAWATGDRTQLAAYARRLAKMGMVCFAIDYRLAPQHKWPAQIDDCRAAVKWIRKHSKQYNVDPTRVGAIGYSAGGHLAALLGTTGEAPSNKNNNSDTRLQAVVAGGAPVEFFRNRKDNGVFMGFLMGGDMSSVPEKFRSATPAAFIDKKDPPFFFFNGAIDLVVPMQATSPLHEELKKSGVKSEMHIVKGAGHALAAMNRPALSNAFLFLKRELSKKDPQNGRDE